MRHTPLACLLIASSLSASLVACSGGGGSGPSATASSNAASPSSGKTSASAATTASAAPKAEGTLTTGELKLNSTNKTVSFSIVLPEGLKDVSDTAAVKQYRKAKDDFQGYNITIMDGSRFASTSLDKFLDDASKDPQFLQNQVKVLDKGTTPSGWFFSDSLLDGKKKAVGVMMVMTDGGVSLMCRGDAEGPVADTPDTTALLLVTMCKTLAIVSK